MTDEIRQFTSGATRDTEKGKLDYEGFMSPIVLEAYAEYLNKHRVQSDGKLRDSDNWQKMFGEKHFDICMKSAWRHLWALWAIHRGEDPGTDKGKPIEIDDALGGLIFNAMAYWFKLLKDRKTMPKALSEAMKHPGVAEVAKLDRDLLKMTLVEMDK